MVNSAATELDTRGARWTRGGIFGGILLVLVGLLALVTPFWTGLALTVVLGAALVIGALIHVAAAFSAGSTWGVVWQVLLGIVYGFAGITVLTNPLLGLTTLTILVIAFLVAEGVVQLIWAATGVAGSRLWFGLSGIVSLLLAALLWSGFPATAIWAVGVLFGVDLLVSGSAMVLYGRNRQAAATTESGVEAAG